VDPVSIQSLAIQLTHHTSVTNTPGEKTFASFLQNLLAKWDYFKLYQDHLWLEQTLNDPYERYSLFALVKGNSNKTIILTGHYDTVSTENYGMLEPLSCDAEKLLEALIQELRQSGSNPQALNDFESGEFLPGRGIFDMKSGLAIGLAVLEQWSKLPEIPANLLCIAVPDEEVASHGMKSVAQQLPELCKRYDLQLELAINLDVSNEPTIFLGSVGKCLPFVLFVGRPSHVGAPFDGLNAALIAAEFTKRLEANSEYGDDKPDSPSPPTVLYHRDNRTHYDVTTPQSVFCAVNVLTHQRSGQVILQSIGNLVKESLEAALTIYQERANQYAVKNNSVFSLFNWPINILTFAELLEKAKTIDPEHVEKILLETWPHAEDVIRCNEIAQALVKLANIEGPAAIVGFAPPYYSRVEFDHQNHQYILNAITQTLDNTFSSSPLPLVSLSRQDELKQNPVKHMAPTIRPFFDGISDMSFFNPVDGVEPQRFVTSQMPVKQAIFEAKLNCPIINIGPWGRDYHQKLERVYTPYAFEVLPGFLWNLIHAVLSTRG
jgi:arginine utilization protein RocB